MERRTFLTWRKLDNVAMVYPSILKSDNKNIFRISVLLKEQVDAKILQKALEVVIDENEFFKVRLKNGFFWRYLEENKNTPLIVQESYATQKNKERDNQDFLFRVTYYDRQISLEVFHAVTDGTGAITFLKKLVEQYFFLQGKISEKETNELLFKEFDVQDSYQKKYTQNKLNAPKMTKAYQIKGKKKSNKEYENFIVRLKIENLKKICRQNNVTATQYLVAHIIWAILGQDKEEKREETIRICIPVNMRKYCDAKTPSNFFSYFFVEIDRNKKYKEFNELLIDVKQEFDKKLQQEELLTRMSLQVKLQKNLLVRVLPLRWKDYIIQIGSNLAFRSSTMILSNLGQIQVANSSSSYIEEFEFLLDVHTKEPVKCGICSFEDEILINFSSILVNQELQKSFVSQLRKNDLCCKVQIKKEHMSAFPVAVKKKRTIGKRINNILIICIVAMFSIGSYLDPSKIVDSVTIPSSVSLLLGTQFGIQLLSHRWEEYIVSQFFLSLMGFIPFINYLMGQASLFLPTLICIIIAVISFFFLYIKKDIVKPKIYF